ncbi:hypothetical protein FOCC_FOCC013772 [Frankliniella occidentalis]|nr:hypothetical protein FOCC_FOCC013772 [Frankliniella occidentalis]
MDAEPAEIITSRRGGKKLLHSGFVYYRRDSRKGNTYWACVKKKECKATAVTTYSNGAVEVLKVGKHDHAPNREEVEAERVVSNLKRIASDHPELPPAQILRTELPKCSEGVLSQLPERENLKKTMRRERARDQPSNPLSLAELREIPDRYQSTIAGEPFIIYDSFEEGDADEEDRFYTTHGFIDGHYVQLAYVPLNCKDTKTPC